MDSSKVARRGGLVAVAWGIIDPIATRAGVAAGLFTDFPGFSAWIAESLGKALSNMSADTTIILLGMAMLAWGWFGDRIKAAFTQSPSPNTDDLSSPRVAGTTSDDSQAPALERLGKKVDALEERMAAVEQGIQAARQRDDRADAVAKCAISALGGRSIELQARALLETCPELPSLRSKVPADDLRQAIEIAEAYVRRVDEVSAEWSLPGPRRLQAELDRAVEDATKELEDMEVEPGMSPRDYSLLRKHMVALKAKEAAREYVENQLSRAVQFQREYLDNARQYARKTF